MSLKEKKVVQSVLVCDYCGSDIDAVTSTHLDASAQGYMKRDRFEFDLCESCASTIGLKRRGRKPGTITPADNGNKPKRGRPRKNAAEQTAETTEQTTEPVDDDWETS